MKGASPEMQIEMNAMSIKAGVQPITLTSRKTTVL